ncbi:hypothetical protein [Methanobrevibacter sp.]|uniref:hypothetical protein n=1 Tax=Methanobrevibacter sp. TaxID=66852 RepID=UPI0038691D5D
METKNKSIETSYDDLKLKHLTLDKLEVCEQYTPKDNNDVQVQVNKYSKLVNKKQELSQELAEAVETETRFVLEYDHQYNDLLLKTDFEEVLGVKRPAVAMKEAWLVEQLHDLYDAKKIAEENTRALKRHIDFVDNRISFERMVIRLKHGL